MPFTFFQKFVLLKGQEGRKEGKRGNKKEAFWETFACHASFYFAFHNGGGGKKKNSRQKRLEKGGKEFLYSLFRVYTCKTKKSSFIHTY